MRFIGAYDGKIIALRSVYGLEVQYVAFDAENRYFVETVISVISASRRTVCRCDGNYIIARLVGCIIDVRDGCSLFLRRLIGQGNGDGISYVYAGGCPAYRLSVHGHGKSIVAAPHRIKAGVCADLLSGVLVGQLGFIFVEAVPPSEEFRSRLCQFGQIVQNAVDGSNGIYHVAAVNQIYRIDIFGFIFKEQRIYGGVTAYGLSKII